MASNLIPLPDQLPLWPVAVRGMPNAFARSALFSAENLRAGPRDHVERKKIVALAGIEILYTGARLRSDDEDVFLQVLHQARVSPLGTSVTFVARDMLKSLKWSLNTASTKRLIDCLVRLRSGTVEINIERPNGSAAGYADTLLDGFDWRREGSIELLREWTVRIHPRISVLFDPKSYSRLDWELRLSLPPLAKQLHKFFHSHAAPFPIKVETLQTLAGTSVTLYQFRYQLKKALALLIERGFLSAADISKATDLVTVVRIRTPQLESNDDAGKAATKKAFMLDGFCFDADDCVQGVLYNPDPPTALDFDSASGLAPGEREAKWANRPYIEFKEGDAGFTVLSFNVDRKGANKPIIWGIDLPSFEAALECAHTRMRDRAQFQLRASKRLFDEPDGDLTPGNGD